MSARSRYIRSSIFASRYRGSEMMDDLSISDERLERALHELPLVNRWLGGYHATASALVRMLRSSGEKIRILDVGTGIGDCAVEMIRMGNRTGADVEVVAIDINERTIEIARQHTADVAGDESDRIRYMTADALHMPFEDRAFDVAHASLFLHHFEDADAVRVLRELGRVGRRVIINDLHRHPLSYAFIRLLAATPFFGEMFSNDGPISVLRSFRRQELEDLFDKAGLQVKIRWHPGFRWIAEGETVLP